MAETMPDAREFWKGVLAAGGVQPIARWRGDPGEPRHATHRQLVTPTAAAGVQAVAVELGVPVSALLIAAHARVLRALTGEREVMTSLRLAASGDALPCRLDVEDGTWRDLVLRCNQAESAIRKHSDFPVTSLQRELGLPEHPYETVLDLSGSESPDVLLSTKIVTERGELRIVLDHPTDTIGTDDAARIAGYYRTALTQLVEGTESQHHTQALLSADELTYQLDGLAGPRRDLPDRRFHELFEQNVRTEPDAVAAVCGSTTWTYDQLNRRANRIAHALLARGVAREDRVAVVTERGLDWMAAVIGIFKAGGTYLPIEPHFPAERIGGMLERSGCGLVLTQPGADANLAGIESVHIDTLYVEQHPHSDPGIQVEAGQLAYIYFTSGSTGKPKGAMCEHAGMLNHLYAKVDDLGIAAGNVVAQTAPQCFDISLWQLVSALLVGGSTLIVEQDTITDVPRYLDLVESGNVEVLQVVPSYLEVLLSYLEEHPRALSRLRCVSATGEALKKELVARWFAAYPHVKLVNAYGLTETSDDTNHEVMSEVPARDSVPLGRPVNNTRVYVVDENLHPVPLGAPGEIVFSGVCVGRGYINDEARTRAAFLADPHRPGQRIYRSGDFGRWLPDGKLEFLGRRDAQVKINGLRIEIGEIENQLLRVPGVRDAAVVVHGGPDVPHEGDGDRDKALVGFYSAVAELPGLRAALAGKLPEYMVPGVLHRLDALPLTGNGKIDKKALTRLAGELGAPRAGRRPPKPGTEQRLATAWAEVLRRPVGQVGRDDHFFEEGGTSLTAIRLSVRLGRQFSLADVTEYPVLSQLAGRIDAGVRARATPQPDEEI